MDGRIGLSERREEEKAHRIRRPLFWSLAFHLLAVFTLFLLGGRAATVPFPEAVDVLLVGASDGARSASEGAARGSPRVQSAIPREIGSPPGRPEGEPGRDRIHPLDEEAVRERASPGASGGSAGDIAVREFDGPVDPPSPAGRESLQDSSRFPERPEASAGGNPRVPGGKEEAAETGSGAKAAGTGSAGMPASAPDPGGPEWMHGSGGGMSALRERIQSRIVYPEEAVRRGQEGEVILRIRIVSGGVPGEIRIARSSGVRLLDDAARRGVFRAAPLPGSVGWVEVPVRFRLR